VSQVVHLNYMEKRIHALEQHQEKIVSAILDIADAYNKLSAKLTETNDYLATIPGLIAAAAPDAKALADLQAKIEADTASLTTSLDAAPGYSPPADPNPPVDDSKPVDPPVDTGTASSDSAQDPPAPVPTPVLKQPWTPPS
jgi:hypothetical protein